jgi:hypothetical protein
MANKNNSRVNNLPAMSCVAARNVNVKNMAVNK